MPKSLYYSRHLAPPTLPNLLSTSSGMSRRYACVLYILTIPAIIFLLFLNVRDPSPTDKPAHWSNFTKPYHIIQSAWYYQVQMIKRNQVGGRYIAIRRDLGLENHPIIMPRSAAWLSLEPNRALTHSKRISNTPRIKRALEFIVVEEADVSLGPPNNLPLSDDANSAPLTLTQDASWDYSNSRQTILDNFIKSAHRDDEEAAAATLAKSIRAKMRAKSKAKKGRKNRVGVTEKKPSTVKVSVGYCPLSIVIDP